MGKLIDTLTGVLTLVLFLALILVPLSVILFRMFGPILRAGVAH
jgi:hypothetical protein